MSIVPMTPAACPGRGRDPCRRGGREGGRRESGVRGKSGAEGKRERERKRVEGGEEGGTHPATASLKTASQASSRIGQTATNESGVDVVGDSSLGVWFWLARKASEVCAVGSATSREERGGLQGRGRGDKGKVEARHPDREEIGEGGTPADSLLLLPIWAAHESINVNSSSERDVQLRRTHITTNLIS